MHHRFTCNYFSKHLKQNIIVLNVEIILLLLHLEDKKVLYIPNDRFLSHLKWIKIEKDMGFENKEGRVFSLKN
jgi:hypothetical protein